MRPNLQWKDNEREINKYYRKTQHSIGHAGMYIQSRARDVGNWIGCAKTTEIRCMDGSVQAR